jgi:hypothetical protein
MEGRIMRTSENAVMNFGAVEPKWSDERCLDLLCAVLSDGPERFGRDDDLPLRPARETPAFLAALAKAADAGKGRGMER